MRTALCVLFLSLALRAQTVVPTIGSSGGGPPPVHTFTFAHANHNTACTGLPTTTCTVTITSTTAGSLLVIWVTAGTSNTTAAISSINAGGTFVHCSNCQFADTNPSCCDIVDGGYVLHATGGTTSIQVTMSAAITGFFIVEIDEITYTGGGDAIFDASGGAALTSCTSCVTTGVTISGTKDYVSRDFNSDASSVTAPAAPWTNPGTITTTGVIGALNQTNANSLTVAQTTGVVAQAVMAFK